MWLEINPTLCATEPHDPKRLFACGPYQLEVWVGGQDYFPGCCELTDTRAVRKYIGANLGEAPTLADAMALADDWIRANDTGMWGFSAWVDQILSS